MFGMKRRRAERLQTIRETTAAHQRAAAAYDRATAAHERRTALLQEQKRLLDIAIRHRNEGNS